MSEPVNLAFDANDLAGCTITTPTYELRADFSDPRVVDVVLAGTDLAGNVVAATLTSASPVFSGSLVPVLNNGANRLAYTLTGRDSSGEALSAVTNELWFVPAVAQPVTLLTDPSSSAWQKTAPRVPVAYATDWPDFPATNAVFSLTSGATVSARLPKGSGWALCDLDAAGLVGPEYTGTLALDDPFETVYASGLRKIVGMLFIVR